MFTGDDNCKVYVEDLDKETGEPQIFSIKKDGKWIYEQCLEFNTVKEAEKWISDNS